MRWSKNLAVVAAALLLAAPFAVRVSAASPSPNPSAPPDSNLQPDPAQLGRDQAALDGVESQISSIGDRLTQLESQAAEAKKEQAQTQQRITQLTAASQALLSKLEAQAADVDRKRAALKEAISRDYQRHPDSAVMMLAENGSVSETLARAKYREVVQDHEDKLAQDAQAAADQLQQQKDEYDSQKRETELLQHQLADLAQGIAAQQAETQDLLANRGNEAVYLANRIAQAKAAQDALLAGVGGSALWGTYADGAQVHRGDVIGFEGSTGNSTGCHTHFSVIAGGHWVNPQSYIDGGVLRRPDGSVTQGYGMTDWARSGAYGGAIHNGVDFVQPCGAPVRAAADGTVIRDNRTDGSGFGHYLMIRHAGGLITLYGHLI